MSILARLPWELCRQTFGYLDPQDKLRLSLACKEYRAYLSPELFETIRFTNDETIAQSALAAVKAHGAHTARIEFVCQAEPTTEFDAPVLSAAASDLLAGLHTPNLHTVRLDFHFNSGGNDIGMTHPMLSWTTPYPSPL
jgi:hypothetical protein